MVCRYNVRVNHGGAGKLLTEDKYKITFCYILFVCCGNKTGKIYW